MVTREIGVSEVLVEYVTFVPHVRLGLTANERAAVFEVEALDTEGNRLAARAVGAMVPEEGWILHSAGDPGLSVALVDPLHADVVVSSAGTWVVRVRVQFTSDYTVA